jgi:copper transport protein
LIGQRSAIEMISLLSRARQSILGRAALLVALLVVALLINARPSGAHGYIVRSIPQDRSVLSRAPSRIQVWFTENLEPSFSTLSLTNEKGEAIPLEDSGVVPTNSTQLAARIPSTLPNGAYVLTIRAAFASDGHVGTETVIFWVGQQTNAALPASSGAAQALPDEVVWRGLTLVALNVLFGALLLYQAVLLPGWGNRKYAVGGLPPRVMARLNRLLWAAIVVAVLGTVLALLQQSAVLFNTDVSDVLRSGLWSVTLRGTQFGDMLLVRIGLLILVAAIQAGVHYASGRQPAFVTPLYVANTFFAALLLGTMSASSHAAGSTLWPIPSVAVDWMHLLATGAWIGGLIALAALLPAALAPLNAGERQAALLAVLRRFSATGAAAVALLIVTGLYSALIHLRQPSDLPSTGYGQTLLFKAFLILPLLVIGLYHHVSVTKGRLSALATRVRFPQRILNLAASVRAESLFGVGVVLVAAVLTATPPPVPPDARGKVEPPSQTLGASDLHVRLSLDPGAAGLNAYQVSLTRNDQPVSDAQVYLRMVYPALDRRSALFALDNLSDGSYFGSGTELEPSGDWQALVDVIEGQSTQRVAFRWTITPTAPDPSARQPSVLNWLSGAAILIVMGVWLWPGMVGRVRSARLQAESVLVGVVVVVITVALTVLGGQLLADAGQRTAALRNPPPQVVNPVLADQNSILEGKAVYTAKCQSCHGVAGAGDGPQANTFKPADFRARLTNRRDEDLYAVIPHTNGTPVQPMTDTERWNVINYLRSPVFVPKSGAKS